MCSFICVLRCRQGFCLALLFQLAVFCLPNAWCGERLARLNELTDSGDLDRAARFARELIEQDPPLSELAVPLARLARAFQETGDSRAAAEFYEHAINRPFDGALDARQRHDLTPMRLGAGTTLLRIGERERALKAVQPILSDAPEDADRERRLAVAILIKIGSAALQNTDWLIAEQAYEIALAHASESQAPTALLGHAWSQVLKADDPMLAAQRLIRFVDRFPTHRDAPAAGQACIACMEQARDADGIREMTDRLLTQWPDSKQAFDFVQRNATVWLQDSGTTPAPKSALKWILDQAAGDQIERFTDSMTVLGLISSAKTGDVKEWARLSEHISKTDHSGTVTLQALRRLDESSLQGDAERLAAQLLSPSNLSPSNLSPSNLSPSNRDFVVPVRARESTAIWAAETHRWSMLSMAAESVEPDHHSSSLVIERLFAESLMQTGNYQQARKWWNHLVEVRQSDEFSTLLRCAEVETSVGDDPELAEQRVERARSVADGEFQTSLVSLVAAELHVRRSQFQQARDLLRGVVQSEQLPSNLRARAQWLTGETHYLQRDYRSAIEAYRKVDEIDGDGDFSPVALVQAGKAFEQLGRTQAATVCYGNLLSRFADTPHADMARRRLAALVPPSSDANMESADPSSEKTIRR